MAADERIHEEVVRALAARGRNRLSGSFRAAVFGAHDGLVSNLALVLGVSASGVTNHTVLVIRRAAQEALTETFAMLTGHGVSTRQAATLTGLVRSTATRRRNAATALTPAVCTEPAVEPANKLTDAERRRVVEVLTSDRFVDLAPLQIYAQLLDEGVYLCSVSTMYRVLGQHTLVAERRRLARHPSQVCPELVATAPQQVYSWDITKLAGPVKGTYFDAYVMIDIYSRPGWPDCSPGPCQWARVSMYR